MLEDLFPAPIVLVSASEAGLWDAPLALDDAPDIAHAAASRQREFAVGRACAREALTRLGLAAGPLPRSDSRAPRWPAEATGSITHCQGFCAAAAGPRDAVRAIGLDAERSGRVTDRILERITTDAEREALAGLGAAPDELGWGTRVWAAKEAALKCAATALGEMPAPREARIRLDPERGRFEATLASAGASGAPHRLAGRYATQDDLVVAGLCWPTSTDTHAPAR